MDEKRHRDTSVSTYQNAKKHYLIYLINIKKYIKNSLTWMFWMTAVLNHVLRIIATNMNANLCSQSGAVMLFS